MNVNTIMIFLNKYFVTISMIFFLTVFALTITAEGQVLPIGANENWITDLWLRNRSNVSITQNVGTLNQRFPDGSIRTIRTDVTLAPYETKRLEKVNLNFDNGLWILDIDPRLEASAYLIFRDGSVSKFELNKIEKSFIKTGDIFIYHRIATDFFSQIGTWAFILNTGFSNIELEFLVSGPIEGSEITRERFNAPPGISQYGIKREIYYGGSVATCLNGCGLGDANTYSPIYVFMITGPTNGGMQGIRYPEIP